MTLESKLTSLINQAVEHLDKKDTDTAVLCLKQALIIQHDNIDILLALADIAIQQKNLIEAQNYLERVITFAPEFSQAQLLLAQVLIDQNEFESAIGLLKQYDTDKSEYPEASLLIALAQQQSARIDEAVNTLSELILSAPDYQPAWEALNTLSDQFTDKKKIYIYSTLLKKNSTLLQAYLTLARIHQEQKNLDQGIVVLQKGLSIYSDNPELIGQLIKFYANATMHKELIGFINQRPEFISFEHINIVLRYIQSALACKDLEALTKTFNRLNNKTPNSTEVPFEYLLYYAKYLLLKNKTLESIKVFQELIHRYPTEIKPLLELAKLSISANQTETALDLIKKAQNLDEHDADLKVVQGLYLAKKEQINEAIQKFTQVLDNRPYKLEAYELLIKCFIKKNDYQSALEVIKKANTLKIKAAQLLEYEIFLYLNIERLAEAEKTAELYQRDFPITGNIANLMALIYREKKQFTLAVQWHKKSLEFDENSLKYWYDYARTLNISNTDFDGAVSAFKKCITLKPNSFESHLGLGSHYYQNHKTDLAERTFKKALTISPRNKYALLNLGVLYLAQKKTDLASTILQQALEQDSDFHLARWSLSLAQLKNKDFVNGWSNYEARWHIPGLITRPDSSAPALNLLKDCVNKRILVIAEQGLGDAIQFCRYIHLLQKEGAYIIFAVHQQLVPLMHRQLPCQIISTGQPLPKHDYQIPLLSLPKLFNTNIDSIPASPSYLQSTQDKKEQWSHFFTQNHSKKQKIGIAFSGNAAHGNDHNRSMPINSLKPIFESQEIDFFIIQKGMKETDFDVLKSYDHVHYLGNEIKDFSDTAAIIEHLDFVISVDTAIIHLCGALGKTAYLLLPYSAEWRWFEDTEHSPWYPSLRLVRQSKLNDWNELVIRLRKSLKII